MSERVKITRNDALHMEVVPWEAHDKREVYELIRDGWHPFDVAKAYGFLVKGRCLVQILESPLWTTYARQQTKKRTTKMFARQPVAPKHGRGWRATKRDKEDALWLADHGWAIYDIAVMLGVGIWRSGIRLSTPLHNHLTIWAQERHDNNI